MTLTSADAEFLDHLTAQLPADTLRVAEPRYLEEPRLACWGKRRHLTLRHRILHLLVEFGSGLKPGIQKSNQRRRTRRQSAAICRYDGAAHGNQHPPRWRGQISQAAMSHQGTQNGEISQSHPRAL